MIIRSNSRHCSSCGCSEGTDWELKAGHSDKMLKCTMCFFTVVLLRCSLCDEGKPPAFIHKSHVVCADCYLEKVLVRNRWSLLKKKVLEEVLSSEPANHLF